LSETTYKPLIFIVDDDPLYHEVYSYNLKKENYENIMYFKSGEDCIANLDKKPDVIILDYEMKGMNGIQTLKKIKEYNNDIKVIICSGHEDFDVAIKSIKLGAVNFIRKNEFTYNKIKFMMKKILN